MATSFDSKLSELEAQIRAGMERKAAERLPGSSGTASPAPRRPRCKFLLIVGIVSSMLGKRLRL